MCVYTCVYSFMRSTVTRIWDEYENYLWNQARWDSINDMFEFNDIFVMPIRSLFSFTPLAMMLEYVPIFSYHVDKIS